MIKTIYWKGKVPQHPEHHQYVINSFLAQRHRDRLRLSQTLHDWGKKIKTQNYGLKNPDISTT